MMYRGERRKTDGVTYFSEGADASKGVAEKMEEGEEWSTLDPIVAEENALQHEETPDKPRNILFSQVVMLNAIVCGLEFCASAAFTYIPPMLLKAGLTERSMTVVLGIGPALGFFLIPVIGRSSDNCRSSYGRRRPFIFGLSVALLLALAVTPNAEKLAWRSYQETETARKSAVVLLILGAIVLDFTTQACLTPCEALLSDACRNTNQQDRCFNVYSFMVSLGGCIGYLITALDWSFVGLGASQEQTAFTVLIVLFAVAMCITLTVADETPLKTIVSPTRHAAIIRSRAKSVEGFTVLLSDPGYESDLSHDESTTKNLQDKWKSIDKTKVRITPLHIVHNPQILFNPARLRFIKLLPDAMQNLFNVPFVLRQLASTNFCSWTAVMGFNLFYTDFVGQVIYHGVPEAPPDSVPRARYDAGVRAGSWGLLLHCITSAVYAACIGRVVHHYGVKRTYFLGLLSFTIVMTAMVFARNPMVVTALAAGTGFAFATVTTIPFNLVTTYHNNKELFFYDALSTQPRGIGADLAVLDSAYFLSQVFLSVTMGYMVEWTGTVLTYVIVSGAMGAVACIACASQTIYTQSEMLKVVRRTRTQRVQKL